MSNTFTGLLRTLKGSSSTRDSMLLSSCEGELSELMHQIDLMVENKRLEWEHQIQGIQVQCERKEKEAIKLRETIEIRNQEVGQLQQRLEGQEEEKIKLIKKYEEQLARLQSEIGNVKKNYGKLQRNANRQTSEAERFKQQLNEEIERKATELERKTIRIQELEEEVRGLENENLLQMNKLKGMEDQRKSLVEKSELMQEQLVGYQGQLTRKKQMLENLEEKHITRLSELENEILQYRDEIQSQKEIILSLKESLEQAKTGEERNWTDQIELKKEIQDLKKKQKVINDENQKLKVENETKVKESKKKDEQIATYEDRIETFQRQMKKKDELRAVDISKMQFNDETEVIRKLQRSINKYQHEIELKSVQCEALTQKYKQQDKRMQDLESECKVLQEELSRKKSHEPVDARLNSSKSDLMKSILRQNEEKHFAEIAGMKQNISSLTEDLHHRDVALADMSERATAMEQELREVSTKFDKKTAELQVSNAQLEALRLENRHLRETTVDDQITSTADLQMFENHLTEMKNANARVVAQLENENQHLLHEIESLREESNTRTVVDHTQQSFSTSNDDMKRVSALEEQLEVTIKNYEEKIQQLTNENKNIRDSMTQDRSITEAIERSHQSNSSPSSSPHDAANYENKVGNKEEMDFSHLFDFLEETNITSGRSSRRQSITTEFINEEKKREEELRNLLSSRISDLEKKTNTTLKKYML